MLMRPTRPDPTRLCLKRGPVLLRCGAPSDIADWIALREASKDHLTAWEPSWKSADVTIPAVRRRMKDQARAMRAGALLSLFVFERGGAGRLIGGVTLSSVKRHAAQSAQIGYWIGEGFLQRGFGRAAVEAVVDHGFTAMGLNRIEAACQPENVASRRLLESLGFSQEGLARDYLHINGAWRDHCLYAMTAGDAAALRTDLSAKGPV